MVPGTVPAAMTDLPRHPQFVQRLRYALKAPSRAKHRLRNRRDDRRLLRDLAAATGFDWTQGPPARFALYDAGSVRIGARLYILGGYHHLGATSSTIEVFDIDAGRWVCPIPMPDNVANSHAAVAADDRYIYCAAGQVGPECRPATAAVFSYDTASDRWAVLPPIPAPRYAATMQLWSGRLHLVGGAAADRWTPTADHWSLGVRDGQATETGWRAETPIPTPGMHRGSILAGNRMYVFGGQQGDFVAIESDPDWRCTGQTQETYLGDCFRLDAPSGNWTRLRDMPIATSHIDFSIVQHGGRLLVFGGQVHKHPEIFRLHLTDAVQAYDLATGTWDIAGYLPYRLKLPSIALHGSRLVVTGGQRSDGFGSVPGRISADLWLADLAPTPAPVRTAARSETYFAGRSVLLLSHDLSRSGAPLVLLELARLMLSAGAQVRLATLEGGIGPARNLADEHRVPLVPMDRAGELALSADIIIVNTAHRRTAEWVRDALQKSSDIANRLVWWIHEIDIEIYETAAPLLAAARLAVFDSEASRRTWQGVTCLPAANAVIHPALPPSFIDRVEQERHLFPSAPALAAPFVSATEQWYSLTRDEIRARLGVATSDVLVTCIGTVERRKGQRMLVQTLGGLAAERNLPIKAMLVGFANRTRRLKFLLRLSLREQKVLSLRRAFLVQPHLEAFYAATDIFVMNSQGERNNRGECFGRVTSEAMAAGAVVMGTDAGGTREIIEDEVTGFLFPPGPDGQCVLADRIEAVIRDRALMARMRTAGIAHARDAFRSDAFLAQFEAVTRAAFAD